MNDYKEIVIVAESEEYIAEAQSLAGRLGIGLVSKGTEKGLALRVCLDGLSLENDGLSMRGDYMKIAHRLRPNNLNGEPLIKAVKRKSLGNAPTAVDATAGLGEDSLLLAAAGFSVDMIEYNPIIAELLSDTLKRASGITELADIANRMKLKRGDSIKLLPLLDYTPDIILLDPMFPTRQKSALVRKKFQLLHLLEQPCEEEKALLDAALAAKPNKIVIKRPSKCPYLAGVKPSYSIEGGGIRYDCIVVKSKAE